MTEEYFTNAIKAIYNLKELLEKNDSILVGKTIITKKTLFNFNEALFFQMRSLINQEKSLNLIDLNNVNNIHEEIKKQKEEKKRKELMGEKNYELNLKFVEGDLILLFAGHCYYYNGNHVNVLTYNGTHVNVLTDKEKLNHIFLKQHDLKYYEVNIEKEVEKLKGKFFNYNGTKYFYLNDEKIIREDYTITSKENLIVMFFKALRNNEFNIDLVIKNCCN
jgi:hypothetical protein